MANLWGKLLKYAGWDVEITAPQRNKCVICVAPHTSNFDFILGIAAYKSLGRNANFLMKDFWFFFPLKYLLRALGGIPVYRKRNGGGLIEQIVKRFHEESYINLAVTPEGTRSRQPQWHSGFLRIAYGAGVPVQLGIIDYLHKKIIIKDELSITGNLQDDMQSVKEYYSRTAELARYPQKFSV